MEDIVIVGKQANCIPCTQLKETLDQLSIPYTFHDIHTRGSEELRNLKKEMSRKGHALIPAVWVNGEFIGGRGALLEKLQLS